MSIVTSRPLALELAVSRRIPRAPAGNALPAAGDDMKLSVTARVVFDGAFKATPDGWRAPARLVETGLRPARHERVDIALTRTPTPACELRVVPHSTHTAQWSGRRLGRYFRLAHAAADALAARIAKPLDAPATGALTLPARMPAKRR